MATPAAEWTVDEALIQALLAEQAPHLAIGWATLARVLDEFG